MSDGRIPAFTSSTTAAPARRQSSRLAVMERTQEFLYPLYAQTEVGFTPTSADLGPVGPARRQSSRLAVPTASCAELLGSESPSASIAEAIVFAVYMPPQLPGPGIA